MRGDCPGKPGEDASGDAVGRAVGGRGRPGAQPALCFGGHAGVGEMHIGRACPLSNVGHFAFVCDRQEKVMETTEKAFLNQESAVLGPGAASKPPRAEGRSSSSCLLEPAARSLGSVSEAGAQSIPG